MLDLLFISLFIILGLFYFVCVVITVIGATRLLVQLVKDVIRSLRSGKHE